MAPMISIALALAAAVQQPRPEDTEQWTPVPPVVTPGPVGSKGGGLAVLDDEQDEVVVTIYDGTGKPTHREKLATQRTKMRVGDQA